MSETRGSIEYLEHLASLIPSQGGHKIGRWVERWIDPKHGDSVVELGTWLGAGTAQAALALKKFDVADATIHTYDSFTATHDGVKKWSPLTRGQDTLPIVKKSLEPFNMNIVYHKGRIEQSGPWKGGPICLHIDDAMKRPDAFNWAIKTFMPSWVPNRTLVVLMDVFYFEKKPNDRALRYQLNWVKQSGCLELLLRIEGSSIGFFRYHG